MAIGFPSPSPSPSHESQADLIPLLESYRTLSGVSHGGAALYRAVDQGRDFLVLEYHAIDAPEAEKTVAGLCLSQAFPDSAGAGLLQFLQRVWRTGRPERYPTRRHQGGRLAECRENTAFRLANGDVALLWEDATARHQSEQHLLTSTEALHTVMDGIPSRVYVSDMQTYELLFLNRAARKAWGAGLGAPCWQRLFPGQAGPCPDCNNATLLDDDDLPTGEHVRDLFEPVTRRWLEWRDQAIHWSNGQWVRMSIVSDITGRKQLEEKLRLASRAFETSEGILITDLRGTIVQVNEAFSRITGYPAAEIIGRNPRILKSDRNDPDLYRQMWSTLTSSGSWSGELWNRRKSGELYPQWLNITAVRDDDGDVTHYVAHIQDISERKRLQERIERQALFDPLTDLPNRRLLLDRLNQRMSEARRHARPGALLFLDLDNFKEINDRRGHAVGDAILRVTAQRLAGTLRSEDTAARFGGDEFIVLLAHLASDTGTARTHALEVAHKILTVLTRPIRVGNLKIEITTSIGVTLLTGALDNPDDAISNADQAMYRAKRAGKNRVWFEV